MKKLLALSAFAVLGLSGAAHAAVLDINLGPTVTYVGSAGNLSPNINLGTFGGLSLVNAQVVAPPNSVFDERTRPNGTLFGNSYLSVYGANEAPFNVNTNGTATFALAATSNQFSFTWGTIDSYNTVVITDAAHNVFTITGSDVLNHIAGSTDGATQSDVSFFDPLAKIVSVELESTTNAFEAGNFGQADAPLPGTLVLFGSALAGLLMFVRARKRKNI